MIHFYTAFASIKGKPGEKSKTSIENANKFFNTGYAIVYEADRHIKDAYLTLNSITTEIEKIISK